MNIKKVLFIIGIIAVSEIFSCTSEKNNSEVNKDSIVEINETNIKTVDYSGVYKPTEETACDISINITKQNGAYLYKIMAYGNEYSGNLIVEPLVGQTNIVFDGKIEDNAPKSVEAMIVDNAILMQNYGNADNQFQYFKKCDSKYLEFKK